MRAAWLIACASWLVSGCSLPTVKSGGACQRSTQCDVGLACVSGKCGKDLSSIAAHNTVPMLGNQAGSAGAMVGGARAAAGGGGMMEAAPTAAGGGGMMAGAGGS